MPGRPGRCTLVGRCIGRGGDAIHLPCRACLPARAVSGSTRPPADDPSSRATTRGASPPRSRPRSAPSAANCRSSAGRQTALPGRRSTSRANRTAPRPTSADCRVPWGSATPARSNSISSRREGPRRRNRSVAAARDVGTTAHPRGARPMAEPTPGYSACASATARRTFSSFGVSRSDTLICTSLAPLTRNSDAIPVFVVA